MNAADILTSLPEWDLGNTEPPIPIGRWGKDHWATFAYIETRAVDHRGMLNHEQMRCDRQRHPIFYACKRRAVMFGTDADGGKYATRLKSNTPDASGVWGAIERWGHDDYDCLDDAIRLGLLTVAMPQMPHAGAVFFADAWGKPVKSADGSDIRPGLMTGLTEMWLMTAAAFSLTPRGQQIASELRAHLATVRQSHQFMPSRAALK